MGNYVGKIVQDVLTMIYQYTGISVIVALLFLNVWKQAEESSWRKVAKSLLGQLKEKKWQKRLLLTLYVVFVMQRTLFNRSPWGNPLGNVLGAWGLIVDGNPNLEMYENILLFLPFYPLFKMGNIDKKTNFLREMGPIGVLVIPFIASLIIEIIQLLTRVGTFQLSDLFYNTLGGFIGGLIYWCGYKLTHRKQD